MLISLLTEKQKEKIRKKLIINQILEWITLDKHRPPISETLHLAKRIRQGEITLPTCNDYAFEREVK